MSSVSPFQVLRQVADAVPSDCHENIVIIGSLAAGFHFFGQDKNKAVRTKDVDVVLEPFHAAVGTGQNLAIKLLAAGWKQQSKNAQTPGNAETPVDQLPVVRLYPPGAQEDSEQAWFLELLTVPKSSEVKGKEWTRLELPQGHFGLPTFRFLSLTAHNALPVSELGIRYAQPMNMALANLLEHPSIKPAQMSSLFAGRSIKRSNKDLGRVLAITILADLDDYSVWADAWRSALMDCFPETWASIAEKTGAGLRALLNSNPDLEEALHTCANGLLSSQSPTIEQLKTAGERLLGDAIERLETAAHSGRNFILTQVANSMSTDEYQENAVESAAAETSNEKQNPIELINEWLQARLKGAKTDGTTISQLHTEFVELALGPIKHLLGIESPSPTIITVRSSFCFAKKYIRPVYSEPKELGKYLEDPQNQKPFELDQSGYFEGISRVTPKAVNANLEKGQLFGAWHRLDSPIDPKQACTGFAERIQTFLAGLRSRNDELRTRADSVTHCFFAGLTKTGNGNNGMQPSGIQVSHFLAIYYRTEESDLHDGLVDNLTLHAKDLFRGLDLISQIDATLFESEGLQLVCELLPEFSRKDVANADKIAFALERLKNLFTRHMIGRHGGGEGSEAQQPSLFYLTTTFEKDDKEVTPRLYLYPHSYRQREEYQNVAYFVSHRLIPTATKFLMFRYLTRPAARNIAATWGALHIHKKSEEETVDVSDAFEQLFADIPPELGWHELVCPQPDYLLLTESDLNGDLWKKLQKSAKKGARSLAAFVVEGKSVDGECSSDAVENAESVERRYLPRGIFAIESPYEDGFSDSDIGSLRTIFKGLASLIRMISHHHSPIDYRREIASTFQSDVPPSIAGEEDIYRFLFFTQKVDGDVLKKILNTTSFNATDFEISQSQRDLLVQMVNAWPEGGQEPPPEKRAEILSERMHLVQTLLDKESAHGVLHEYMKTNVLEFLESCPENFTWSSYLTCMAQTLGDRMGPRTMPKFSRMTPGFSASGMFIARIQGELRQVVKLSSAEKVDEEADRYRKWVRYRLVNAARIPPGAFEFETTGRHGKESGEQDRQKIDVTFETVKQTADGILVSDLVSGERSSDGPVHTLLDAVAYCIVRRSGGRKESDLPTITTLRDELRAVFTDNAALWAEKCDEHQKSNQTLAILSAYRIESTADKQSVFKAIERVVSLCQPAGGIQLLKVDYSKLVDTACPFKLTDEKVTETMRVVHGDMNARNLTWSEALKSFFLIDFEHTGPGIQGADQMRLVVNLMAETWVAYESSHSRQAQENHHDAFVAEIDNAFRFLTQVFRSLVTPDGISGLAGVLDEIEPKKVKKVNRNLTSILKEILQTIDVTKVKEWSGKAWRSHWSLMFFIAALKEFSYTCRNLEPTLVQRVLGTDSITSYSILGSLNQRLSEVTKDKVNKSSVRHALIRHIMSGRLLGQLITILNEQ